jgi:transcriptional regulator with XRE-family HTH domain
MDRRDIADRLDELIRKSGKNNVEIGELIGVGKEAVRKWREGVNSPKLENIEALADHLGTSEEFILFGVESNQDVNAIRERICQPGDELTLLRLFRASNREGRGLIVKTAGAYQLAHPAAQNIYQIHKGSKKRP